MSTARTSRARRPRFPGGLAIAACAALAIAGCAASSQEAPAANDWTRFGWDEGRSDAATVDTGLSAKNVGSLERQQVDLGGTVDSSPIYLHGVSIGGAKHDAFFVTTIYGRTLAIDAGDGSILWTFTPPGYADWAGSYRITTASPVADPDRAHIYAASPDGHVQKLAVADGSASWSTAVTTLPQREKIAAALNLHGGRVVVATGGYIGDQPPYQGHVAVLDAGDGSVIHVFNALCSDRPGLLDPSSCKESGAAIWGRAGAVIDASSGNIFVATGDAVWDGDTNWGDAVLELAPGADRLLGNFTPANTDQLDTGDVDLGSSAPVLLGDGLVLQGGKDAILHLLDWGSMKGASPHKDHEVQTVDTPSGKKLFTAPAVWHDGDTTWVFAADGGGTAAWKVAGGKLEPAWHVANAGTSPVLAGGLLYVFDPSGGGLRIYRPDSGDVVATLDAGKGHWNTPIAIDGRIALPEGNANQHQTSGVLDIWRLPQ